MRPSDTPEVLAAELAVAQQTEAYAAELARKMDACIPGLGPIAEQIYQGGLDETRAVTDPAVLDDFFMAFAGVVAMRAQVLRASQRRREIEQQLAGFN
jgi:hypothetical protein